MKWGADASVPSPAEKKDVLPRGSHMNDPRQTVCRRLSPLFRAALKQGSITLVRFNLTRGADVDGRDARDRTPLMLAAIKGHTEVCRLLLEAGADPVRRDRDGRTAACMARDAGHTSLAALLSALPPDGPGASGEAPVPEPQPSNPLKMLAGDDPPPSLWDGVPDGKDDTKGPLDDGSENGLDNELADSGWEPEPEPVRPADDRTLLVKARTAQSALTRHAPVTRDSGWTDVDIDLPDAPTSTGRGLAGWLRSEDAGTAVRALLLRGLREGSVAPAAVEACCPVSGDDAGHADPDVQRALVLVLCELGIRAEEYPFADDDDTGLGQPALLADAADDDEAATIREAMRFLHALTGAHVDPLTPLVVEASTHRLLDGAEEAAIGADVAAARRARYAALAWSPAALDVLAETAGAIGAGTVALSSAVEQAGSGSHGNGTGDASAFVEAIRDLVRAGRAMVLARGTDKADALARHVTDALHALGLTAAMVERMEAAALRDPDVPDAGRTLAAAKEKTGHARDRLVIANMRLVLWQARRYGRLPYADRVQEGLIGLMRAAERFDPDAGAKFSTYAVWWIRQSMSRAIADTASTIRLPVHMHDWCNKVRREYNRLSLTRQPPTPTDLAISLGTPTEAVIRALSVVEEPVRLEAPDQADIADHLPLDAPDPEDLAMQAALRRAVWASLEDLSSREREVICLRFGLLDGEAMTLEEVGQSWRVTRERIRQIEAKALGRLSHPARSRPLRAFLE